MEQADDAVVAVIMGSESDWDVMEHAVLALNELGVPLECFIISAHRTPDRLIKYVRNAQRNGIQIIIAGAGGGAAHLAGVVAANTSLPVHGVPIQSESVPSTLGMPGGVPVASFSVGKAGAKNAALQAVRILALHDGELACRYQDWVAAQARKVQVEPKGFKALN